MIEAGALAYDTAGLITAVAQDAETGEVLMVAHMNKEALERTMATGEAWYWSRSRRRLWRKGETSGHTQRVRGVRIDCDADAVLLLVDQAGPACHTGHRSCFYRAVPRAGDTEQAAPGAGAAVTAAGSEATGGADAVSDGGARTAAARRGAGILDELAAVLQDRLRRPRPESYTARLFAGGLARLNEKVMEEAAEVARAARKETPARLAEEAADLWFHTLALLVFRGVAPADVFGELVRRRR
jgi:phosphoribosyl-ATP pyrophosphohydrolase/phosphoribosyl-AMP cyclohydrolase